MAEFYGAVGVLSAQWFLIITVETNINGGLDGFSFFCAGGTAIQYQTQPTSFALFQKLYVAHCGLGIYCLTHYCCRNAGPFC